jgi:hypothetical protein
LCSQYDSQRPYELRSQEGHNRFRNTRVQSDILNRVQESRSGLEVEIRKLLHEIRRIAEQALTRARAARAEGASAVQAALVRLNGLEDEIRGTKAA